MYNKWDITGYNAESKDYLVYDTLICVTYLSSFVKEAHPIIASDVEISIILYYIILNVVVQTDTSKYRSLRGITNSTIFYIAISTIQLITDGPYSHITFHETLHCKVKLSRD
jgi:hypothetical protein